MTEPSTLPADVRDDHKERVSIGLLSIRLAAGHGGLKRLARATGVSEALWKRWEDPDDSAGISLADVATLAEIDPVTALTVTRLLTDSMGALVGPAPRAAESMGDWLARLARLTRELSDVLTALSAALADGHLDPQELAEAEREMTEALHALLEGINAVKAARREHGVIVPLKARETA